MTRESKPSDPADGQRGRRYGSPKELVAVALSTITLVGLLYFVLLRSTHSRFYAEFGLSPEDVGLDYLATLTRTSSMLVQTSVFASTMAVIVTIAVVVAPHAARRRAWIDGRMISRRVFAIIFAASVGVSATFFIATIGQRSPQLARQVHEGWTVPSDYGSRRLLLSRTPTWLELGIRAEPVSVLWKNDRSSVSDSEGPLTYLGRDDDSFSIYDPESSVTLVIPKNEVIIAFTGEHRIVCSGDYIITRSGSCYNP